jgi:hypothetical protein
MSVGVSIEADTVTKSIHARVLQQPVKHSQTKVVTVYFIYSLIKKKVVGVHGCKQQINNR